VSEVNAKLLDLLSQVTSSTKGCFYTRLGSDAKEFIDACVEVRKSGRHVSAEKVSDKLAQVFKIQASESGVRRHLKEACTCHTTKS
jgi:hypothetical protein